MAVRGVTCILDEVTCCEIPLSGMGQDSDIRQLRVIEVSCVPRASDLSMRPCLCSNIMGRWWMQKESKGVSEYLIQSTTPLSSANDNAGA